MGHGAAGGDGGTAADVLSGAQSLGDVAGAPPKLMGQAEVSSVSWRWSLVFWVLHCGAEVAGVECCSPG